MDVVSCVIAIIQLADRVVDLSSTFIGHAKGAEKEIVLVITTITGLKVVLEFLQNVLEK